ncbi:MAG: ATP-binding protein [Trichodesmium sp. MAG_R03]|nr:ATP-binding protein [Trichodesmium sp. MAG_R03]
MAKKITRGNFLKEIPLTYFLVIPFLLQLLIVVGLTGWLSFRNGQKAINNLASKLRQQVAVHIVREVRTYLQTPHRINQLTAYAIKEDNLSIFPVRGQGLFLLQMNLFKSVQWIYCGSPEKGEFMGITRLPQKSEYMEEQRLGKNDMLWLAFSNESTNFFRYEYALDSQGNTTNLVIQSSKKFDSRNRPWYQAGESAGKATWSEIYEEFDTGKLTITATLPVYDSQKNLKVICGVDIFLCEELSPFLKTIEIGDTGEAFILNKKGILIASSIVEDKDQLGSQKAVDSNNSLIKSTTQYLIEEYKNLSQIDTTKKLNFIQDGERIFMQVSPYKDKHGLHWLTVVVIPEKEFMAQINENTKSTIRLCILALAIALGLGLLIVNWITKSIKKLSTAAYAISHGELNQNVSIQGIKELVILATSFNKMTKQLVESFNNLERKNQELQELDQLKDEFLANTSHELRTPLNGIIGIAESMMDGATGTVSELQNNNLSMIVGSGHRLANLVNDILDFSKLRHHSIKLQMCSVGMREVTEVVLAFSRIILKGKDLQLINAISSDLPPVEADENRIQQIMHNLVGNAIKFTEAGVIRISAELIDVNNNQKMAITVSDTGIGIPEDKHEAIFASFEQGDGSTERQYGGTGLGLPITKKLVELHGGTISVKSTPGIGSEFTFTLNISKEPVHSFSLQNVNNLIEEVETSVDINKNENHLDVVNNGDFHILVVDDEPINIQVLNNYLKANNYQVTQALSGKEALAALENNHNFDLILLDIMMPNMTGYEVCSQLREKYPAQSLPVLMLTAKNQIADLVMGFRFGANDYLTKPFAKDELLTRIKTHIQLSKITKSYERFVPHEYVQLLSKESIINVQLGDRVSTKMAIFFSDIRSFTTISEEMTSQETFAFVNGYLKEVCPEIRDRNGLIIKFLGDGIMAVFPDSVDDAVQSAIAQLKKLQEYNQTLLSKGWIPVKIGIGIHWGHMMVGIVGEEGRMSGDAFSNNVNLTARLEGLTKFYGVSLLISESAFNCLKNPQKYQIRFLDRASVKGIDEPINVYEVFDGEVDSVRELKLKTQVDFALGLKSYRLGELVDAEDYFKKVLAVNSSDETAQLYLERIKQLMKTGVPKNWKGVWTFRQK